MKCPICKAEVYGNLYHVNTCMCGKHKFIEKLEEIEYKANLQTLIIKQALRYIHTNEGNGKGKLMILDINEMKELREILNPK